MRAENADLPQQRLQSRKHFKTFVISGQRSTQSGTSSELAPLLFFVAQQLYYQSISRQSILRRFCNKV